MRLMVTYRLLPFFFVLSVGFSCKVIDDESPDPSDIFVKYYGTSGSHAGVDLIYNETLEQYILLGYQDKAEVSGSDTRSDFYFVSTTKEGNQLNSATIDIDSLLGDDIPVRIKQIDENTYLFVGSTTIGNSTRIVWGRISHELQILDSVHHIYANPDVLDEGEASSLRAADIMTLSSDPLSIVIFGTTDTPEDGDEQLDGEDRFYLTKRELETGTNIWTKSIPNDGNDIAKFLFETASGFLLFGETETGGEAMEVDGQSAGGKNVYILGATPLGGPDNPSDVYGFAGSSDESTGSVLNIGGGYAIMGTTVASTGDSDPFLLFIDESGNLRSSIYQSGAMVNDDNLDASGYALARTLDGGYLVLGSYVDYQEGSDLSSRRLEEILVMKADPFGIHNPSYDDNYGLVSGNDRADAAITLPDGKVAVLCTFDFGSGVTLLGLMKINANGQLRP